MGFLSQNPDTYQKLTDLIMLAYGITAASESMSD